MGFNIEEHLEKAYKGEFICELAIKIICMKLKEILSKEENVVEMSAPVTLVGDVHGQFYDVQEIFRVGGDVPNTNYLFLGDYVDRGAHSVEVITLLSLLKIKYPQRVTLLRGNHETRGITQNYGFYMECIAKYGNTSAWEYFTDMFDYIPIAAVVEREIFCVHGGLSPSIETIEEIRQLNRFREIPNEGPFSDLMWSDPDPDNNGFTFSARGAGFLYGEDVLTKFLYSNNVKHIVRAHQLCMEGYQILFNNQLSTVWSAPNYLYRFASILELDECGNRYFNIFADAPENKRKAETLKLATKGFDKDYFI